MTQQHAAKPRQRHGKDTAKTRQKHRAYKANALQRHGKDTAKTLQKPARQWPRHGKKRARHSKDTAKTRQKHSILLKRGVRDGKATAKAQH